ncbi:MAG: MBL fold metallo-hydrolase [Bacteroidales bacterium]|nr:MBL fold metallo-hydrolase [Bacteroidales bacterium]
MDRRSFLGVAAASVLAAAEQSVNAKVPEALRFDPEEKGILVKFLGTGAASGSGPQKLGRRHSAILVENEFLVDLTEDSLDLVPEGLVPEALFYTHSHPDHYEPSAALKLGVKKIYVSNTWFDMARKDFTKAAKEMGVSMPQMYPIVVGAPVQVGEVSVTAVPANHATDNMLEQTVIYLLEKNGVRLLYATDTAGITGFAARMIGIDAHKKPGNPITGLIMEATMGMDHEEDFRLYNHSSVMTIIHTVNVLMQTERLRLPAGDNVYVTHMSKSLHDPMPGIDARWPKPLKAASDGLEVVFHA